MRNESRKPLLRKIAEEMLGDEDAGRIWKRVEIIGDIVVIRKPFDYPVEKLRVLAEELLREIPQAKSVWLASSPVEGSYRLREYAHLAGEPRSETIYKEHGCLFKLDIRRVYVSPRLNYEHQRVANLVKEGEVVLNMFAGAGLYSIIIAKLAKPRLVYSIDINPDAYKYMVENIRLNKVEDKVVPILGDAARVVEEKLLDTCDRVIMAYPELALEYLDYAIKALRPCKPGYVHVFMHTMAGKEEDPIEKTRVSLVEKLEETPGIEYKIVFSRIVRTVGPRRYQVVHDVEIHKLRSSARQGMEKKG